MATGLLTRLRNMRHVPEPVCVAESNGAKLLRHHDGRLSCACPFACLATYEDCEFDPTKVYDSQGHVLPSYRPSFYETGSFPG